MRRFLLLQKQLANVRYSNGSLLSDCVFGGECLQMVAEEKHAAELWVSFRRPCRAVWVAPAALTRQEDP